MFLCYALFLSFSVDIGALWKCGCDLLQRRHHSERGYAVKRTRLQPGIRQDPGGLCICLDSSRGNGSKDCLRDMLIWDHPHSYLYTGRTVWKVTPIHKHTADCMREHPCTWTCLLSCPQHVVSPCCLNVNKPENMILDPDDELKTFLNEAASFYLVLHWKPWMSVQNFEIWYFSLENSGLNEWQWHPLSHITSFL